MDGQQQADPERIELLTNVAKLPAVHSDLAPGDVIFFHGNTLHRSDGKIRGEISLKALSQRTQASTSAGI